MKLSSRFVFFRAFEFLLLIQGFFIIWIDMYCGLVFNRFPYCLYFVLSHLLYSIIFSSKGAQSLLKRKTKSTPIQELYGDLEKLLKVAFLPLAKFLGIYFMLWLYFRNFISVISQIGSKIGSFIFIGCILYTVILCIFVFFITKKKTQTKGISWGHLEHKILNLKDKILNIYLNRYLYKKICLFNRKTRDQKIDPFTYLLKMLSSFSIFNFAPLILLAFSFYFDNGRTYALAYFFLAFLTYLLRYSYISNKINGIYGANSLRLLGWNMFSNTLTQHGKRAAITGGIGLAAYGLPGADKELGAQWDKQDLKHAHQFDVTHNLLIDQKRENDQQGALEGKYPYRNTVADVKPLGSAAQHLKRHLGYTGEVVSEAANLKNKTNEEIKDFRKDGPFKKK